MVGLLDIAPLTRNVNVNGQEVTVYGISAKGVAYLLDKFPMFKAMFIGGGFDPQAMVDKAPDLVAAIIAAGTGSPGDSAAEERASLLPLDTQLDFLEAVVEATMPKGPGPFVQRLTGLLNSVKQGQAPDSPQNPIGKPLDPGTATSTSSQPVSIG